MATDRRNGPPPVPVSSASVAVVRSGSMHAGGSVRSERLPPPHVALRKVLRAGGFSLRKLAGPAALAAVAQGLHLLQGNAFVGAVNKARLSEPGAPAEAGGGVGPVAAALGLTGADLGAQYLRRRAWRGAAQDVREGLRTELIDAIMRQDLAFFEHHGTGQLINLVTEDTQRIGQLVEQLPDQIIEKAITVGYAGFTLVRLSPKFAIAAALPLPVLLLPSLLLGPMTARRYGRSGALRGDYSQALESMFSGITDVKLFQAEGREATRLHASGERLNEAGFSAFSAATAVGLLTQGIGAGSVALVAAYGGGLTRAGRIRPDDFARVLYLYPMLLSAVADIESLVSTYHEAAAAAARVNAVLEAVPQIASGPNRLPRAAVRGALRVENVSFAYQSGRTVLRDVSFDVGRGEMVAIVGRTGSGKSTLLRLLARLYEVEDGRITLDGRALPDLDIADLRAAVALVSQDTYLFDGTIRDNLLYGKLDATDEELHVALKSADALDLVARLPEGLDAEVGERGSRLSGGERQRVAIARTILRDAPVLLLDEITSHLDYETEDTIRRSIDGIAPNRTLVVVTHRLATIRHATRIVVLDAGRVVEIGSHDELVAGGGVYAKLWGLQTGAVPAPKRPRRRSGAEVEARPPRKKRPNRPKSG